MSRGDQNLIMGFWSGLPFEALERFIGSLRRTRFNGDVCVFVDNIAVETVAALIAYGIHVERADRFTTQRMNNQASRYHCYLDFLVRRGETYRNVMISDLRDVVFQSDPFANPLPAEIVFAQERCLLGESPVNRGWLTAAYGHAVAHNLRDCPVSCSGTTFGTVSGMLRYLAAMTHELCNLRDPDVLRSRGMDQGIHNYVIRMRPLQDAWLDVTDSLVATMHFIPDAAIETTSRGVLIDGRLVPVVHQWDRNKITLDYVWNAPQFRLDAAPLASRPPTDADDCIVAFYHRERDAEWLPLFLDSLRCIGFRGGVHCIGAFSPGELQLLSQHGCAVHAVAAVEPLAAENVAHFYLGQVLDKLAEGPAPPDQVLVFDSMRAVFLRNPFLGKTTGLSVFSEGPTRLGESEYNVQRLAFFVAPDANRLRQPIASSALLRGKLATMRGFYHKLLAEFVGRSELLASQKAVQGAINKLCHDGGFAFPIVVHPNGGEAYFDFWPSGLAVETTQGVRVGGAVPAVILGASPDTELLQAVRTHLGLAPAGC